MDFVRGSATGARAQAIECDVRPANGVACHLDIAPTASVLAIEKVFYTGENPAYTVSNCAGQTAGHGVRDERVRAVRVRRVHRPISGPVLPSPRPIINRARSERCKRMRRWRGGCAASLGQRCCASKRWGMARIFSRCSTGLTTSGVIWLLFGRCAILPCSISPTLRGSRLQGRSIALLRNMRR